MRRLAQVSIGIGALLASGACAASARAADTVVGDGYARTSVNAVIFRHSPIVSHGQSQFVSWYGPDGALMLAKRKHGDDHWQVARTQYKGDVSDAHRSISMGVDGDGYLHVSWDHHNNKLHYCRSKEPESLELTGEMPMTGNGEDKVSYPEFYNRTDGSVLFLYRDGASGNGNLVLDGYDPKTRTWTQLCPNLISGEGKRNAYWQATADGQGGLHLSWVWRESPDVATNHDVCYAKSTDGGHTWTKSDGTPYALPITLSTAEVAQQVPQRSDLINQTSMFADADGHPYVATYWRPEGAAAPQFQLVYNDGKAWKSSQVLTRTLDFHLAGGGTKRIPVSRPLVVAKTTNGVTGAYFVFRDAERGDKVSLATCADLANPKWEVTDLTTQSVGQWEPTYDPTAWQKWGTLDLFVQRVGQGDAEHEEDVAPQPVRVLEWEPK